jgi:hypothetical protein
MIELDLDLHIHSKYSFDSLMKPESIIKIANEKRLNVIAVTDHGTIKGGLKAYETKKSMSIDILVVVGAEIHTDLGDIIGLFLTEDIKSREIGEVIDEIRSQSGLVLLPHPFKGSDSSFVKSIVDRVDLIELLNSRSPLTVEEINTIKKLNRRFVGCSDAHFPREIGLCRTVIESSYYPEHVDEIKKLLIGSSNVIITGSFSHIYLEGLSQLIGFVKARNYKNIPDQVSYAINRIIK